MLIVPNFLSSENGDSERDLACQYSLQRNNKEINSEFLRDILQDCIFHFFFVCFILISYATLFTAITKSYLLFKFQYIAFIIIFASAISICSFLFCKVSHAMMNKSSILEILGQIPFIQAFIFF